MNNVDKAITNALKQVGQDKLMVNFCLEQSLTDIISDKRVQFVNDYEEVEVRSEVMNKPTYMDLALFVNKQIVDAQDDHHVFLEDIYPLGIENENTDNEVHLYAYALGS